MFDCEECDEKTDEAVDELLLLGDAEIHGDADASPIKLLIEKSLHFLVLLFELALMFCVCAVVVVDFVLRLNKRLRLSHTNLQFSIK